MQQLICIGKMDLQYHKQRGDKECTQDFGRENSWKWWHGIKISGAEPSSVHRILKPYKLEEKSDQISVF